MCFWIFFVVGERKTATPKVKAPRSEATPSFITVTIAILGTFSRCMNRLHALPAPQLKKKKKFL